MSRSIWRASAVIAMSVAITAAAPVPSGAGAGRALTVTARMTPGQVVSPSGRRWHPPRALRRASGSFSGTIDPSGSRLAWRFAARRIGRPAVLIADIHVGARGQFGRILVRLCTDCLTRHHGTVALPPSAVTRMRSGRTWVTLLTDKHPNGILRGQIAVR